MGIADISPEEIAERIAEVDRPKPELWKEYSEEEYEEMHQRMVAQAQSFRHLDYLKSIPHFPLDVGGGTLAIRVIPGPYDPCPCGTPNAKFKWCCFERNREELKTYGN